MPLYFKYYFVKEGCIRILTNVFLYYNLLFFLNKSTFFQTKSLTDCIVVDYPNKFFRFSVAYLLLSLNLNFRLIVSFCSAEIIPLISTKLIFPSSNWLERESWDFYGIYFIFNNDLRRIFTDYGFKGYPLRKDFPLYGFSELFYNQPSYSFFYVDVQINKI